MMTDYKWDFFLAHAGPDRSVAERLYEHLEGRSRVFLDVRSLDLGADWDSALAAAQKESFATVVFVSSQTPRAYYLREEIAAAIELARSPGSSHKVIPLFLGKESMDLDGIPYGLRLKHGIVLDSNTSLDEVASRLLGLIGVAAPTSSTEPPTKAGEPREEIHVDPWSPNPGELLRSVLVTTSRSTQLDAVFHWEAAILLARACRLTEAVEALEVGDGLAETNDSRRLLPAGFVYLRTGRYTDGESLLREYLQQRSPPNREAAIAFDLLGSELRRQVRITEAEDRFKSALRLKRKVGDDTGQGITLGNLGRMSLYAMRLPEAIAYLEENLQIAKAESPEFEGIARNNLAEALVVAQRGDDADEIVAPIFDRKLSFTERDRGFAQVVTAELALSQASIHAAERALQSATHEFEACSEENGLHMVGELEGIVAVCKGWRVTAAMRFAHFDEKLGAIADPLFSVYRWRRRANLGAKFGDERIVVASLEKAKRMSIQAGLPSEEIEAEARELKKAAHGLEPNPGTGSWYLYWTARMPKRVGHSLKRSRNHPLGVFFFAEEVCDVIERIVESALGRNPVEAGRRSFGQKLQRLRSMVQEWVVLYPANKAAWRELIRSFEAIVELRNKVVHGTGMHSGTTPKSLELIRVILRFLESEKILKVHDEEYAADLTHSTPDREDERSVLSVSLDGVRTTLPAAILLGEPESSA